MPERISWPVLVLVSRAVPEREPLDVRMRPAPTFQVWLPPNVIEFEMEKSTPAAAMVMPLVPRVRTPAPLMLMAAEAVWTSMPSQLTLAPRVRAPPTLVLPPV